MGRFGFCGPSYTSQSPNVSADALMNWYVEPVESGQGKGSFALYPTQGLGFINNLIYPCLAYATINGRLFVLNQKQFGEILANGSLTPYGNITGLPSQGFLAVGTSQILIVAGGHAYVFNYINNTWIGNIDALLAQPGPALCGYSDGYFIVVYAVSNAFQISGLLDATSWNGLNVSQISVFTGNINAMLVDHRELWLWGSKAAQVYYNTGAANTVFQPIQGAFIEQGCASATSPVKADNSLFWMGQDERGCGIFWRASGYTPTRVSDHAVEWIWSQYPRVNVTGSTVSDVVTYSFQDQGHTFIHLYFPTANASWRYDTSTGMWFQVGFWNTSTSTYSAHNSRCHAFVFGKHIVGDWASGNIYEMSLAYGLDNASVIRRRRVSPVIAKEQQWIFHHQLQVDLEVGLGNTVPPGQFPTCAIRYSDDATKTWSNEIDVSAGQQGETKQRVIARRLGKSRQRNYELVVTDPIPWRVADAYLKATPDYTWSERLPKVLTKVA